MLAGGRSAVGVPATDPGQPRAVASWLLRGRAALVAHSTQHAHTRLHAHARTQGALTAHASVADHTLADLPPPTKPLASASSSSSRKGGAKAGSGASSSGAAAKGDRSRAGGGAGGADGAAGAGAQPVLLLVDTAGCGCEEQQEEEGDSKCNPGEAKVRAGRAGRACHTRMRAPLASTRLRALPRDPPERRGRASAGRMSNAACSLR